MSKINKEVKTPHKFCDTALFNEMIATAGKKINGLFCELTVKASKVDKSGDYDYSKYLKNKDNEQTD